MTITGRWRVDWINVDKGLPIAGKPILADWFEHEADALTRETELRTRHDYVLAWFWSGEYVETPAEEAARMVRERLGALVPWLREAS